VTENRAIEGMGLRRPAGLQASRRGQVSTGAIAGLLIVAAPSSAFASEAIDGRGLSLAWGLPFIGILASIALGPTMFPNVWHHHYGKISLSFAALTLGALAIGAGGGATLAAALHTMLLDYLPFVILIFALYTIAGGILIRGNIHGSPLANAGILLVGTLLASVVGTTGASMILIRPLIRANDNRRHNAHIVVFFIFLVSNIGGSLTPLGDPPLFVGFLRGVDFFWPTQHIAQETATVVVLVITLFVAIDAWIYRAEGVLRRDPTPDTPFLVIRGGRNFVLLAGVVGAILVSAAWRPGLGVTIHGVSVQLQNLARDGLMIGLALLSLLWTPSQYRKENGFTFEPVKEVAKIFAGIFIAIIPVLAMLSAREEGALAPLMRLVSDAQGGPDNAAYFWLTGALSSFLDNVPTYLVFFELAGGDAHVLMGYQPGQEAMAGTLAAISSGAVFMGAMSYVGNAPNFMVYAVAKEMGVRMPSFLGYMAWSCAILLPIFTVITYLFFT
jgi:Na+/H+ antiporter NhaD/arsenite permease-like protein